MRVFFIYSLILMLACNESELYKNCCGGLDQHINDWVWIPSSYSPNGDGLNDVFRVVPKRINNDSIAIQEAWGLEVRDYKDQLIYEQDSLYNGGSIPWNFIDGDGKRALGNLEISYLIKDHDGVAHAIRYEVCSFTCQDLEDKKIEIDFSRCRFEDMLDPKNGFVAPTNEPICP